MEEALSLHWVRHKMGLFRQFCTGRVLDYGCGGGQLTRIIAETGCETWGVDSSPERIDKATAESNGNCRYKVINRTENSLPFDRGFFDTVFASEIIEHVPDLATFIGEIKRVLRQDGVLFLTTPNGVSYRHIGKNLIWGKSRLRTIESWPQYMPQQEGHLYYWDLWTLYRLMHINGFTYLAHNYYEPHRVFSALTAPLPFLHPLRTGLILVLRHSEPEKRYS